MTLNKIILKFVSISFSILVLLLVAIGLLELGRFCYDFGYRVFTEEPVAAAPGRDVMVQVTDEMSEREIGEMLEKEGLVRDDLLFFAQLKLSAYSKKLQPGVYTLNTSMTGRDMMAIMAAVPEQPDTETESDEAVPEDSTEGLADFDDGMDLDGAGDDGAADGGDADAPGDEAGDDGAAQ